MTVYPMTSTSLTTEEYCYLWVNMIQNQKVPMALCYSPDIFQEKMNELFNGVEYVKAYTDDLFIISNDNFEYNLNEIKKIQRNFQQLVSKPIQKNRFSPEIT